MPFLVEIIGSDSLAKHVPDEGDCYLIGGYRQAVVLIPFRDGPEADAAWARFRAIPRGAAVGAAGLSPDGVLVFQFQAGQRDETAMHVALALLARTTPFAERRRRAEAACAFLDELYSLVDSRPEEEENDAQAL